MDSRLDSAGSTSDRGSRNESGSSRGFTGASPARVLSSVGVMSASSMMAEPFLAWPKYSKRLLSDARDGLRAGIWRMAVEPPSGDMDTLARSTCSPPVSGSLDLAFLPAAVAPLADESCCHDCVLSTLTVRDSEGSMDGVSPARRRDYPGDLLLRQANALA